MEKFMITLLLCSITMSVLALFYMAITPLLAKRYSVTGRYYTWLVVVIGLIPFRPSFHNALVQFDMPGNAAMPTIQMGQGLPFAAPVSPVPVPAFTIISWGQIAAAVWLAGMILFLVYHAIKHYRFLKLTARWSENITDQQMQTCLQSLKTQLGLTKTIGLQYCDSIGGPMMIGFTNPRILLPKVEFTADELCFILHHELVHYKRKDLWYKSLVLIVTAIHWFNPIVYLMAKVIDMQCELSCDKEVVKGTNADTRLCYTETIISTVKRQSKRKTALSTNFYGGKKGMKKRIFSIMDMNNKKTGIAVLCSALVLTVGVGFTFAASSTNTETQYPKLNKSPIVVSPWIAIDGFVPSPDIYGPYAAFGISISDDGKKLLYKGQSVRQFVDEKADGWAFYRDESGSRNIAAVRNAAGEITGIEKISAQKAQAYYEEFFAEEHSSDFLTKVNEKSAQVLAKDIAKEWENKYAPYQPFGVTYSASDIMLYYNGQRVKFFIDKPVGQVAAALWADEAGTVSLAVIRDASGQITGIESISAEKVQEYESAVDAYMQNAFDGLEERIETKMQELYPEA